MNNKAAVESIPEMSLNVSADDAPILAMVQEVMSKEDSFDNHDDGLLTLALEDLLADTNGEVVLFNDSNMRAVGPETRHKVLHQGEANDHQTASGDDVSGFHFMSFENGTTLFFQDGLNVIIVEPS